MATRLGLQKWFPDALKKFGVYTVFDLLKKYIRAGRIKIDKSRHPQLATYHDPCNYGRKSEMVFGHGYYEEPRWIMDERIGSTCIPTEDTSFVAVPEAVHGSRLTTKRGLSTGPGRWSKSKPPRRSYSWSPVTPATTSSARVCGWNITWKTSR